jgi:hypothetical protein
MLTPYIAIVATLAIVAGLPFLLPKITPRIPRNRAYRFIFWFVFGILFNVILDYLFFVMVGGPKASWIRTLAISSLLAIVGTLFPPQKREQQREI